MEAEGGVISVLGTDLFPPSGGIKGGIHQRFNSTSSNVFKNVL
jgi:hypothetical protein